MFVDNNYLIWFDNTDFLILINRSITSPGYWQICVEHILIRSASSLDHGGGKTDLPLANMKINIFPPISTIAFPKVLTPCNLVHLETLAVIYLNACVTLKVKEKNNWRIVDIQTHVCNVGKKV